MVVTFTNAEIIWIDGVIDKLLGLYGKPDAHIHSVLSADDALKLVSMSSHVMQSEGSLVEVEAPIKVVGDIHGQYQDMLKLFDVIGRCPQQTLMFLGDYVDRGAQSLETICLLLAWKMRYPTRIYLLRGNHETAAVNRIYGFYDECCRKYGAGLWWDFQTVFNRMPMAGLISKRILCMHGGLSPELHSLDIIRQIQRPCEPQDRGLLIDLLWADPTNKGEAWYHSPRGISYAFGKGVMAAACNLLQIDMLIRAHQVVQDGYELMVGGQLITVFSAPNYAGQFNNAAAAVCIDAELQVSFQQLRLPPTPSTANRPAPMVAADPTASQLPAGQLPTFRITPQQNPRGPMTLIDLINNNAESPSPSG